MKKGLIVLVIFVFSLTVYADDNTSKLATPPENINKEMGEKIPSPTTDERESKAIDNSNDLKESTDVDTSKYEALVVEKTKSQMSIYWLMIGINGFIPINKEHQLRDTYYTIDAKIGMNFYKFLGGEIDFGYYMQPTEVRTGTVTTANTISSERMDIRLYVMLQPEFAVTEKFKVIPYVGVGVNFSFLPDLTVLKYTNERQAEYDVSINVAAKIGVRAKVNMFMFGVGAEYINASAKFANRTFDLSNFNIGAEIGFVY